MTNATVYRTDASGRAVLSTERARCARCGVAGYVGDWPEQGGLVASPEAGGRLLCDDCASETETTIRIRLRDNETPLGERLAALVNSLGVGPADVIEHDETGPYLYLSGVSEVEVDLATRWDSAVIDWEVLS